MQYNCDHEHKGKFARCFWEGRKRGHELEASYPNPNPSILLVGMTGAGTVENSMDFLQKLKEDEESNQSAYTCSPWTETEW